MADAVINYKGKSESAEAAARKVAVANEKAALKTEAAWKKAGAAIGSAGKGDIKGLSASLSALGGPEVLAAGAALGGLAVGLTSIVNAGREQLKATRLTEAVLRSTGGAAGVTSTQIEGLASSLSTVTGIQDEVIQSGENVLLTFTRVHNEVGKGNDVFSQAVKAGLDLSATYGRDLQSQIIAVGKALNDPIRGLTALSRGGTQFTDQQKKQIKTLVESNHLLDAQKIILKELQTQYGGAAAAAADPFSKLNTSLNELKESLGTAILPQLNAYVGLLNQAATATLSLQKKTSDFKIAGLGIGDVLKAGAKNIPGVGLLVSAQEVFGDTDKNAGAAAKAVEKLGAAQKKYADDVASGSASRKDLAKDAADVAIAQAEVNKITKALNPTLDEHKKVVDAAAFAYLGFGNSIKTAADAAAAISKEAFAGLNAKQDVTESKLSFQESVTALHSNPDTSSGGGGGQTAAAAAIEHAQKLLAVRDANRAVEDSARGVIDAQKQIVQSQQDAAKAAGDLVEAQKQYDIVLHGVAQGSKAARIALDDFTSAQDAAKSAALDLSDAQQTLADAIENQRTAAARARNDVASAGVGLSGAKLDLTGAKEALGRARQTEDPTEIARAQQAVVEAQQRVTDATQARSDAQKHQKEVQKGISDEDKNVARAQIGLTEAQIHNREAVRDQTEAQRVLNGVLHGYAPSSKEAKQATEELHGAQQAVRDSTDSVAEAQRGLRTAQDQTATSALDLKRSLADLNGQLDSTASTKAAKKGFDDFIKKTLDVQKAAEVMGDAVNANVTRATGSAALGILAEVNALKDAVAVEPLLAGAFNSVFDQLAAKYAGIAFHKGTSLAPGSFGHAGFGSSNPGHGRAGGGPVSAGRSYLIGEKGPELFVPKSDGHVVPHASLKNSVPFGGGGLAIRIEVHGNVYGDMDMERIVTGAVAKHYRNGGQSLSARPR